MPRFHASLTSRTMRPVGQREIAAPVRPFANRLLQLFPIAMTIATSLSASTIWEKTNWRAEPAWTSVQGSVRAVVTEARERLIYLGAVDGTTNLLNAPYPQVHPTAQDRSPNQGGHRFWLGPQKRWVWPPIFDWEYAGATSVTAHEGILTVRQPRGDGAYPAITREYAWEGERLRCTARWHDDGRPYFGMHVVPVDLPFVVRPRLAKTAQVPLGVVNVQMEGPVTSGFLPHPAVALEGDHAEITAGRKVIKLGFVPQPLTVDRVGGWRLTVAPGPNGGVALESPDEAYLSQVWVGGTTDVPLAELEQLTPYLRGDANGECSSTIYLEATPPAPSAPR